MLLRLLIVLLIGAALAGTAAATDAAPLFAEDSILKVRIEAPLTSLMRDRPDEDYLTGSFSYESKGGETQTLSLKVRTRGNYRRDPEHCDFAPLRLNFRKSEVVDSLFAGQDKLKLVTHCRSNSIAFRQFVLREYLIYRFLNQLTEVSYRVRLLHIEYVDTEGQEALTRYGFVIEDDKAVAARNELQVVKIRHVPPEEIDRNFQNLLHVFEYMVGNTEYSFINPEPDKNCCHNADVLSATGGAPYIPLLFDFDFSGLVHAPYAEPNPRYPVGNVRIRHYKGLCNNNDILGETLQRFRDQERQMFDIIEQLEPLSTRAWRSIRSYLAGFYRVINDPEAVERKLQDQCYETEISALPG